MGRILIHLTIFFQFTMAAPMIKSLHSIQTQSGMNLDYVVYVPERPAGKLPLVLFLHGAGERGKNIDLIDN